METTSVWSGRNRLRPIAALVALVLMTLMLAAGCGSTATTAGPGTTSAAGGAQVTLQNFAFSPASATVNVGDTVTWTNKDSTGHTVTADDGTTFTSPTMATGATFSFTFTKTGTYAYHCSIHPTMTGTIVVQ